MSGELTGGAKRRVEDALATLEEELNARVYAVDGIKVRKVCECGRLFWRIDLEPLGEADEADEAKPPPGRSMTVAEFHAAVRRGWEGGERG